VTLSRMHTYIYRYTSWLKQYIYESMLILEQSYTLPPARIIDKKTHSVIFTVIFSSSH
jgi:hypothetical protein